MANTESNVIYLKNTLVNREVYFTASSCCSYLTSCKYYRVVRELGYINSPTQGIGYNLSILDDKDRATVIVIADFMTCSHLPYGVTWKLREGIR